jgi:CRISPR/Cas system-associated exonuclease Cas4 (RecB family)
MLSLILLKGTEMLNHYKKELLAVVAAFSLISYAVYVVAAEPVKTKPIEVKAKKVEPAKKVVKEVKKVKEVKPVVEPAKNDPNRKKPTLKAKYADKK